MNRQISCSLGCVLFVISATMANAADIYRWVDEKGQTHVSDAVPAQYQPRATKINTNTSKISDAQRAEAAERLARQKSLTDSRPSPTLADTPNKGTLMPPAKSATSGNDQMSKCDRMRQAYRESQKCFGQFSLPRGVRGEAHDHCTEVRDPSSECGAPTDR